MAGLQEQAGDGSLMGSGNLKTLMWVLLVGITIGGLMGISIKYPVKVASITEATKLCEGDNLGLEKLKVGISGKMYYVKCKNQKEFEFK